jgi:hypothetical protein
LCPSLGGDLVTELHAALNRIGGSSTTFEVRGTGGNVKIAYLTVEAGPVQTSATLPWASEEYRGTGESDIRIEANGPAGSRVTCVVRYRPIHGSYGGGGSGSASQRANPDEDQTACALDHVSFAAEG